MGTILKVNMYLIRLIRLETCKKTKKSKSLIIDYTRPFKRWRAATSTRSGSTREISIRQAQHGRQQDFMIPWAPFFSKVEYLSQRPTYFLTSTTRVLKCHIITVGGGAPRVGATPDALRVGALTPPKLKPLHAHEPLQARQLVQFFFYTLWRLLDRIEVK